MFRKVRRICYNIFHPVIGEIWQLHHVTRELAPSKAMELYYITPSRLETMILEYRGKGYEFISLDDIQKSRKKKFIALTLDDGYADNYLEAWPVFKQLSVPFCIFVATDFVFNDEVRNREKGMTPEQLKEIASDPLCTVGGHTKSHCHLDRISEAEQSAEIADGISVLEEFLAKKINHFAYPFGDFDERTERIVCSRGLNGYAAWGDPLSDDVSECEIPRILK